MHKSTSSLSPSIRPIYFPRVSSGQHTHVFSTGHHGSMVDVVDTTTFNILLETPKLIALTFR
jgi:hypothetical protein